MTFQVLLLVLLAALIHAMWNTWLKLAGDRLVVMSLMGAGWASFAGCWLPFLGVPGQTAWLFLIASVFVHLAYTLMLVTAYRLVDLSVAYPMIRGTGPAVVTLISAVLLGEHIGFVGSLAVLLVAIGVLTLGWHGARGNLRAVAFGALSGGLLATYTLLDGIEVGS